MAGLAMLSFDSLTIQRSFLTFMFYRMGEEGGHSELPFLYHQKVYSFLKRQRRLKRTAPDLL